MAATVTGSKTTTAALSPRWTTSALDALLSTAPENILLIDLYELQAAIAAKHTLSGQTWDAATTTLGDILT